MEEQTIDSRQIYAGHRVKLRLDRVMLHGGRETTREVVEHPDCVAIVAIDAEDNVILVRQFRHAVAKELLEIPAGGVEASYVFPAAANLHPALYQVFFEGIEPLAVRQLRPDDINKTFTVQRLSLSERLAVRLEAAQDNPVLSGAADPAVGHPISIPRSANPCRGRQRVGVR